MALSAATGFRLRKSLYGIEPGATVAYRVANSATLKLGDAVRVNTAGFLVRAAAGNPVLGIVDNFRVTNRSDVDGTSPFALGGTTGGATLTEDDSLVTASDNQTRVEFVNASVIVDPAGILLFYNDADTDLARTQLNMFFDVIAASNQITGTGSDANGQFQLIEIDPDGDADLSKGLFRIAENQLHGGIDSATAKNAA